MRYAIRQINYIFWTISYFPNKLNRLKLHVLHLFLNKTFHPKKLVGHILCFSFLGLYEMAEQYASGKGSSKIFDANLEELFAFYFLCQEEEEDKIMQIKTFIGIVTLVKIIEEKFLGVRWLIEKRNFAEKDQAIVKGLEENWLEFKRINLVTSSKGSESLVNMKELLAKIYSKFIEIQSLPTDAEDPEG
jgi:hypothetical protein